MRLPAFESLVNDMKDNNIEKEHYDFVFNGLIFDTILSFAECGYEILIAVHSHNWGCVLQMDNNFYTEMPNEYYNSLCKLLGLNWSKDKFNSSKFLRLLSEKAPNHSNRQGVSYVELRQYLPYRKVDESEKIYFCGWNDHQIDKRQARNFDKTEFYLGKTVADYCRKNNISSRWTDIAKDEKSFTLPWNH